MQIHLRCLWNPCWSSNERRLKLQLTDDGEKSKTIEEIMMENNQYGNQNPFELPDNSMTKEEKLIESYTPKPNERLYRPFK